MMFDSIDPRWSDSRDRDGQDELDREIYRDSRERGDDPRDALLSDLDLPRGRDRELVLDRDRAYELNGDDSGTLAAVGAFRVIPERDLDTREEGLEGRNDSLEHLIDEGLVRIVSLDGHDRGVTLTDRGRDLLEANCRDHDDDRQQVFYAGVNRPRELSHDAQLYRVYERAEKQLRDDGADVRRVVLEQDLKREYQSFLQEHNRDRPDSDGRPDRDPREIAQWAFEHELPYFDDRVHFPDFRIEYDLDGHEGHRDVEVLTPHYRGTHAASRGRTGFTCVRSRCAPGLVDDPVHATRLAVGPSGNRCRIDGVRREQTGRESRRAVRLDPLDRHDDRVARRMREREGVVKAPPCGTSESWLLHSQNQGRIHTHGAARRNPRCCDRDRAE
jgi:hypothetical protein